MNAAADVPCGTDKDFRGRGRWGRRHQRDRAIDAALKTSVIDRVASGERLSKVCREVKVKYNTAYAWLRKQG